MNIILDVSYLGYYTIGIMKRFIYDQLVTAENICNLTRERTAIGRHFVCRERVVVYAPRNFGKTSLLKNVVIPSACVESCVREERLHAALAMTD